MSLSVPVVPTCSSGEGNTNSSPPKKLKKINPAIRWCFTLNNYTTEEYTTFCSIVPSICRFCIIAKETGELSNTPHLQGYLEFIKKTRPASQFQFTKRIHWEKAKGDREDNIEYCSKQDPDVFFFPNVRTEA